MNWLLVTQGGAGGEQPAQRKADHCPLNLTVRQRKGANEVVTGNWN